MIAQSGHPIHGRKIARKLAGLAKPDGKQRTLGSSATAALVSSTVDKRFEPDATPHEQGADTLWGINLMAGNRQQIDAEFD